MKLVHLKVNGEEIVTTEGHPFYVKDIGFVNACELSVGDKLTDSDGKVMFIESVSTEVADEAVKVYNFQVEDTHTYFVSDGCILVHNADGNYGVANSGESGSVPEKIIPPKQINGGTFDVDVPEARFIGDSPVSGSHNATVKIINADGDVTKVWREVSGNATESEIALGPGKMRQATHTEQRALTRFELTDETVLFTGQNPPCKNCQGAMRLKNFK